MNLGMIFRFCQLIDDKLQQDSSERPVALVVEPDPKKQTNAVFLLGAYMILRLGMEVNEIEQTFASMQDQILPFCDVCPGPQMFDLHVSDCWRALARAKAEELVDFGVDGFDLEEYEELDDPSNADLHEVVKGKFIAMRGPKTLDDGCRWRDRDGGVRDFSPAHYADILAQFDVQVVVRLNEPEYNEADFHANGIAVADLPFDDCTTPPPDVVARFLMLAESLPGALAVHCKAGLGRTGTLIALYLMKHHGFGAREAIGWLRIVRPGSVIGPQQQYLCGMEGAALRAGDAFRRRGPEFAPEHGGAEAVARRVAEVDAAVRRRLAAAVHKSCTRYLRPSNLSAL